MTCGLATVLFVTAFAYNAVPGQTDGDPGTSRCGRTFVGQVALSQDLWRTGRFRCGDVVTVGGRRLVAWDAMAAQHRMSVDVLVSTKAEADRLGKRTAVLCPVVAERSLRAP